MPRFIVRPYAPDDRAALHRIAADTAFFGEPVEAFLPDRQLFCDAFCAYYTDLEPEPGWIASAAGEVVGFIVGSVDTGAQQRRWARQILPRVAWRALRGRYRLGRRTWAFALRTILSWLRGEVRHVDLVTYPAHLHINVAKSWRGQGIGHRLMRAYLDRLRALGAPGVHLSTTDLNVAACHLYEAVGFQILDRHPSTMWSHLVDRPVEHRYYGLKL